MKRKFTSLIIFGVFVIVFLIAQLSSVKNAIRGEFLSEFTHVINKTKVATQKISKISFLEAMPEPVKYYQFEQPPRVTRFTTNIPIKCNEISTTPTKGDTENIQQLITNNNKVQKIRNHDQYGPITNETILITIQVHNRISYLTHLIDSLKETNDIQKSLLIFSHDVFDNRINELVEKINFCMVMQIFYPYPIQTHSTAFPGDDPRDCPRNATRKQAKKLKCLNYEHPDIYGHYREAKFTQMKHHWWWKLNRIFDQLDATKYHTGFLLLLEEDYYVAADFIPVMKLMQGKMFEICPECNLGSIGTYNEYLTSKTFDVLEVRPWITTTLNMGMFFNRTTWSKIRNCSNHFCEYDEYNYDWSLQNVNRNCLEQKLVTALIRGPRVYHLGECGVHHARKDCNTEEKIKEVKKSLEKAKKTKILFPSKLKKGYYSSKTPSNSIRPNGGWGDERDRCLCLRMTLDSD